MEKTIFSLGVERKWKVLYTMLLIPRKAGRKKA
jgi:hypothetical protein